MSSFPNYAGRDDVDDKLRAELDAAGIIVHNFRYAKENSRSEVKTGIIGELHGWKFERTWCYWRAEGPGLPPTYANPLHATHGEEVRVDGHCGCP
jgi:hypothetical protein